MPRGERPAPPAAPGEDVATRMTLNYALGNLGGRQKSWMNAGQSPPASVPARPVYAPKKRGRPPKYLPNEPGQAPHADLFHGQPLSNSSTSPQLANVVSHSSNGQYLPSPTAVLPSPLPNEDAAIDIPTLPEPTALVRNGQHVSNGVSFATGAHAVPRNASPDDVSIEGAQQAAALPRKPSAVPSPTLANKRPRTSLASQGRPIPPPLGIFSAPDVRRRVSVDQDQSTSPTANPPFSPALRQHTQSLSPYQPHGVLQRVPNQPHIHPQQGPMYPPVQSPLGPPRQSPLFQNAAPISMADAAYYVQEICRFVTAANIDPGLWDNKRIKALEMAAQEQDWDFLVTHLFYCVLTLAPDQLPAGVGNSPHAPALKKFLGDVLDVNDSLTPPVKEFFLKFPMPIQQMSQTMPRQVMTDIHNFTTLMSRSANYFTLKSNCDARDFPPLMHELVYDLGIKSRQLQRIVFTAAIRRMWSRWGSDRRLDDLSQQFEQEALGHFAEMHVLFSRVLQLGPDAVHEREAELHYVQLFTKQLRASYVPRIHQVLQLQQMQMNPQFPVLASQHTSKRAPHPQQPMLAPSAQQTAWVEAAREGRGRPRGRPRLGTQQPQPQPQPQRLPKVQLLFPAHGVNAHHQAQPNPGRFGLHQAHLRDANLQNSKRERLYLYTQSFVKVPQRLTDAGHMVEKWSFTLTPNTMAKIPKDTAGVPGGPPVRIVDDKSLLLRLRCIKWNGTKSPNPHSWATSDTSWIPYSYFTLNGKHLEQRKKLHYGKDQPIDLTPHVKEGENTLEISIVRTAQDIRYRNYLVAIESLGVKSHDALMEEIKTAKRISAATIKQRIREKLAGPTDDDEIVFVNSTLNIRLFDPFIGSKMCDVPVRSKACDHFDCFDLLTFLETRKRYGDATVADHWKCPICNGDARPQHLFVDGFMEEVREELEKQGALGTREIIMNEDGTWKPRPEVLEGVADDDENETPVPANTNTNANTSGGQAKQNTPVSTRARSAGRTVEVIDLGDSDDD